MAIARTQAVSANANNVALSSTTLGDLIVVFAYSTSTTIPTIPAGYITIRATAGTQQAAACGWKVSAGGETTTGTWTNAAQVLAMVYSGASVVGQSTVLNAGSSTSLALLNMVSNAATGYYVAFGGAKSATSGMNTVFPAGGGYTWTVGTSLTTATAQDAPMLGSGFGQGTAQFTISPTSRWQTIVVQVNEAPPNPYFVAAGAAATTSGSGGGTVTFPNNVLANDIAILVTQSSNQVITQGGGWTEIDTQTHMATGTAATAGSVRLAVWWFRCSGTESGASNGFGGVGATDHCIAQILIFRGCATSGNPWSDVGTGFFSSTSGSAGWGSYFTSQFLNGSSQTPTTAFNTTVADSYVVEIIAQAIDSASAQMSLWSCPSLTGFAELTDVSTATGTGGGFGAGVGAMASPGNVDAGGPFSTTFASASKHAIMVLALIPPPTGTLFTQSLTATLSFVGDGSGRLFKKLVGATQSFSVAIRRAITDSGFTATLNRTGALTKRLTDAGFVATLSSTGAFTKSFVFVRSLTATLSFIGDGSGRLFKKLVGATLSYTAALTRRITDAGFTATLSFVGDFVKNFISGGVLYYQSFTATLFGGGLSFTDDFNRADGALGANWTTDTDANFSPNPLAIVSNVCKGSVATAHHVSIYSTGGTLSADQYAQFKVAITGGFLGAVLRSNGNGTFYVCYYQPGSGNPTIFKWTGGGAASNITASSSSIPAVVGDVVYFEAVGSALTMKVNGVTVATATDSSITAAGYTGINIFDTTAAVDDFSGGELGGGGPSATLSVRANKALAATLSFVGAVSKLPKKALSATLSFIGTFTKNFISGGILYLQSFTATLFGGSSGITGNLLTETFDNTTDYDNAGWTASGAVNPNYTGTILEGTQSCFLDGNSVFSELNHTFTSQTTAYVYFQWRTGATLTGFTELFRLCDTAGFDAVRIFAKDDPAFYCDSNGVFSGALTPYAINTTYHFWVSYVKGTGANAQVTVGFSTTGIRPTSGSNYVSITNGAGTVNAERLQFRADNISGWNWILDRVAVNTTQIGDAGTAAPAAALSRKTGKGLSATWSPVAALTRKLGKALSATLSFVGALTKRSTRFLAATLSFTGLQTASKSFLKALTATLSFVGAMSARIIATRAFTATLSFTGASARRANKAFAATLSFVGALVKRITDAGFSATLSFVGALTRRATRALAATLSFIGDLTRNFIHGGTQFTQSLVASLSFIGTLSAKGIITRAFAATLNATASLSRSTLKAFSATLAFPASLVRRLSRLLSATLSNTGAMVKAIRDAGFTATLSFVGNLVGTAAHFFTRAFTASLAFSATLTRFRLVQRVLAATLAFSGAIQRRIGKSIPATLAFSAAIRRNVRKVLRGTLAFIGFIFRGGAVTVLAGWITKCFATIGIGGSTAKIVKAGSQLDVVQRGSGAKIAVTGSTLRVERTK